MDNKKYNVIILNTQPSESVVSQLASLFKIPTEKAHKILQKNSFVIKKQTDKATAEKFHKAITATGVNCRIDEIIDEEEIALPEIEEINSNAEGKPLTDITRPEIKPLRREQVDLSLEAMAIKKPASEDDIKATETIDPANFCPECGTIRASADADCIHCGFDPLTLKQSNFKATLIKITAAVIIIAAGLSIGFPFYQQYAKRMQVETDLILAFDTRNSVTEFIQRTNFWPNQNIDAGLEKQINNQSIKSVVVGENAVITVTIRAQALEGNEQTLILTPNILKGRIVWNCLRGTLIKEYRPEICQARKPD